MSKGVPAQEKTGGAKSENLCKWTAEEQELGCAETKENLCQEI